MSRLMEKAREWTDSNEWIWAALGIVLGAVISIPVLFIAAPYVIYLIILISV